MLKKSLDFYLTQIDECALSVEILFTFSFVRASNGFSCLSDSPCDRLECINLIDSQNDCLNHISLSCLEAITGQKYVTKPFTESKMKHYLLIAIYSAAGLIIIF